MFYHVTKQKPECYRLISESEKRKHFFKTSQYEIGEKAVTGLYGIARLLSGLFLFKKKTRG